MKILVTGANGFLGHHVVRHLQRQGHEVTALVRKNSDISLLKDSGAKLIYGDLEDLNSLTAAVAGHEAIVHAAGYITAKSNETQKLFRINVQGTRNLVEAAQASSVSRFIHISSSVAVGALIDSKSSLLTEVSENITIGKNFGNYDSKRIAEEFVLQKFKTESFPAIVLNPSLIYGAGDARKSMRAGNVKAANGKLPFYTSGGVSIVAVEDVVEAIESALTLGRLGQRYLITGDNIRIQQLLSWISESAGAPAPTKQLPDGLLRALAKICEFVHIPGTISNENIFAATSFHWYDHSKATEELNFKPRPAKEAIAASVQWMKDNGYIKK